MFCKMKHKMLKNSRLGPRFLSRGVGSRDASSRIPGTQFERTDWMTLNGPWQFAFDDSDAGLDAHWYAADHALSGSITRSVLFREQAQRYRR
jgi:hypothetical protein